MKIETGTLTGDFVRLEPLSHHHVDGLVAASAGEKELYRWSPIPQGKAEAEKYVETALIWQRDRSAVPYATVRIEDGAVIGSTRFFNLDGGRGRWGTRSTVALLRTGARLDTPGSLPGRFAQPQTPRRNC